MDSLNTPLVGKALLVLLTGLAMNVIAKFYRARHMLDGLVC